MISVEKCLPQAILQYTQNRVPNHQNASIWSKKEFIDGRDAFL